MEELEQGVVNVKRLADRSETTVQRAELVKTLRAMMAEDGLADAFSQQVLV